MKRICEIFAFKIFSFLIYIIDNKIDTSVLRDQNSHLLQYGCHVSPSVSRDNDTELPTEIMAFEGSVNLGESDMP